MKSNTQFELVADELGRWEIRLTEKHGDKSLDVRMLVPIVISEGQTVLLKSMQRTLNQVQARMNINRQRLLHEEERNAATAPN